MNNKRERASSPTLRRRVKYDPVDRLRANPNSFFEFPLDERNYLLQTLPNPLNYPEEYVTLYNKERQLRSPNGYENLHDITDIKFTEFNRTELNNPNCIISKSFMLQEITIGIDDELSVNINQLNIDFIPQGKTYFRYNDIEGYRDMAFREEELLKHSHKYIPYIIFSVLHEFRQYICIAGGYALSYYTQLNYKRSTKFDDIDLFIHSCDENMANQIVQACKRFGDIYENGNVIGLQTRLFFTNIFKTIKIQIIKRLYRSPSEIIHGFDVDSSCILINHVGQVFATERFIYATEKRCNFVNFDRLSPSYEYRLLKYLWRGYNIYIPQMEFFKRQCVMDVNVISKKGSGVILRSILHTKLKIVNDKELNEISDYYQFKRRYIDNKLSKQIKNEYITFETMDPQKQIINTFHRTILEDIRLWYPFLPNNYVEMLSIGTLDDTHYNVVEGVISQEIIYANNLVRRNKIKENNSYFSKWSFEVLKTINNIIPNCHVYGDIPLMVIGGYPYYKKKRDPFEVYIFSDHLDTRSKYEIVYQIWMSYLNSTITLLFDKFDQEDPTTKKYFVHPKRGPYYISFGNFQKGQSELDNLNEMIRLIENPTTTNDQDIMDVDTGEIIINKKTSTEELEFPAGIPFPYDSIEWIRNTKKVSKDYYKVLPNNYVINSLLDDPNEKGRYEMVTNKITYIDDKFKTYGQHVGLNINFFDISTEIQVVNYCKSREITADVFFANGALRTTEEVTTQVKYDIKNNSEILPYPAIENYVAI